ncbi:MAG: OmpA family protein [Sulfuriferula sp.]
MIPLGSKPVPPAPGRNPRPSPRQLRKPLLAPAPPAIEYPAPQSKTVLEGTNFDFNKATLRPAGKAKLDKNTEMLITYPDINVEEIAGYTDSIGTQKYNLGLSKHREIIPPPVFAIAAPHLQRAHHQFHASRYPDQQLRYCVRNDR